MVEKKSLQMDSSISRRKVLRNSVLGLGATSVPGLQASDKNPTPNNELKQFIRPPKLSERDTIGIIAPASGVDESELDAFINVMNGMGLNIKFASTLFERYGYLGGTDLERAMGVNELIRDPEVKGLFAARGGYGCARMIDYVDFEALKANPKIIYGYSDITALHMACHSKANITTFHGPVGVSHWNTWDQRFFKNAVFETEPLVLAADIKGEYEVIGEGQATGQVIGGNLTVFTSLCGTRYFPDTTGTILILEDISEDVYRIDRMLMQLKLAGALDHLKGFIFASCKNCGSFKFKRSFTLNQVLRQYIEPLEIPSWIGFAFGHITTQFTIPLGEIATIDTYEGSLTFERSAVE